MGGIPTHGRVAGHPEPEDHCVSAKKYLGKAINGGRIGNKNDGGRVKGMAGRQVGQTVYHGKGIQKRKHARETDAGSANRCEHLGRRRRQVINVNMTHSSRIWFQRPFPFIDPVGPSLCVLVRLACVCVHTLLGDAPKPPLAELAQVGSTVYVASDRGKCRWACGLGLGSAQCGY